MGNRRVASATRAGRLCLGVAVLFVALVSAGASARAAERYATPSGGASAGSCDQAAPCTAAWAAMGAADGDDVVLAPGSYSITAPLKPGRAISIHGVDGQPAPMLTVAASVDQDGVSLAPGSSLRHVDVSMLGSKGSALVLTGARGEDLLLYDSASGTSNQDHPRAAARLVGDKTPTVLADSVADATGSGVTAVVAGGTQDGGRVTLANVTAVAQAAGSVGVDSTMAKGSLTLTNVIARGAAEDVVAATRVDQPVAAAVSYSNFRAAESSGYVDGGHNQQSPPLFAAMADGDFHELTGSPTIDAGIASPDSGPADPDGRARTLGSAPDIGAYEFDPAAAGAGGGGSGGSGFSGSGSGGGGPGGLGGPGGAGGAAGGAGGPGAGAGLRAIFASGAQSLPRPRAGLTFVARRIRGVVLVQVAHQHGFVPLPERVLLPFGSQLDTRHGAVAVTAARDLAGDLEVGQFHAGVFSASQQRPRRSRSRPTVLMTLTGNELAGCRRLPNGRRASVAVASAARRRRRHRHRSLWGSDTGGNFSTHGQNSVAAVRGTVWLTQDYCTGTLTRVVRGRVLVHDLVTGRRVLLAAGQHYFSDLRRAPRVRRRR